MPRTPKTVFIGAGAVATVMARRMALRGYPIAGVISRTRASAAVLAEQVGAPVASSRIEDLPEAARWVMLCVPDDALGGVIDRLKDITHPWEECVVVHTAGAVSSRVLDPMARLGAAVVSAHPVQTFQRTSPPDIIEGITFTLEGDDRGVEALRPLVTQLGGRPVTIDAAHRTVIHLAATLASNYFVTLMAAATEVLMHAGVAEDEALNVLQPLVEGTWDNMLQGRPEQALTGPIERGDLKTVKRHVSALQGELAELAPLFDVLARKTARLAATKGSLTDEQVQKIDAILDQLKHG